MSRAEALRDLAAKVETGTLHKQPYGGMPMATACYPRSGGKIITDEWSDAACLSAYHGSLDGVARLEAPLRERGWEGPHIIPPQPSLIGYGSEEVIEEDREDECLQWSARWHHKVHDYTPGPVPHGGTSTEPRARLLAVLRALLHEAEAA